MTFRSLRAGSALRRLRVALGALCLALAGPPAAAAPGLTPLAQLGEKLFHDETLSASGRMSCATCHEASRAFAGADGRAVPLGGPRLDLPGLRNTPTLMYLAYNPPFHLDAEGVAAGGLNRDGRAATLAAQAAGPLLAPFEMANLSAGEVVNRLQCAPYADELRAFFGAEVFDDAEHTLAQIGLALQAFQVEDRARFAPFDSKYDAFLAGHAQLSAQETRGRALFEDPVKGNCAACHPSRPAEDGTPPLFPDFSYDSLGVPRHPQAAGNDDPAHFDLGLCGPLRTDLAGRREFCGAFKVPTLRNVELTAPYFHNGRFATLPEVLEFYARRDTHPQEWYPADAQGRVRKYDDLPPEYARYVNSDEVPYDRRPGDEPALSADEIEDIVAFLRTLTDGYAAGTRSASAQHAAGD